MPAKFPLISHSLNRNAILGESKRNELDCPRIGDANSGNDGFSLVELSIVLVILGLLTGGILTGQNLIRAAELRSVTTEFQSYQTAVMTFRDKYFALPGDMRSATDFWGASAAGATCATTAAAGTATCNGDANGDVDLSANSEERMRFWQHLANAGLIEGSYTGVAGGGGSGHGVLNENIPAAKFSNSGWYIQFRDSLGSSTFYDLDYGNGLQFGAPTTTGSTLNPALTPEEAWNIDTKMDDGKPGMGKIMAVHFDDCGGAPDETTYDTDYVLTTTSAECALIFPNAF